MEDVKVEARDWKGRTTFVLVDMDSFDVILGLEWVDKYVISQFGKKVDKLLLDNEDRKGSVIVNMYRHKEERVTNQKAKIASLHVQLCSAKVASKALKKGGKLFLCTSLHKRIQENQDLKKVCLGDDSFHEILNQFSDVLTKELSKTLSPQRSIDHQIPLVSGSMPPAKAPYRMSAT